MPNLIKLRLLEANKKQVDLLAELRKRGYSNMSPPYLSNIINGVEQTTSAQIIKDLIYQILDEWKSEVK